MNVNGNNLPRSAMGANAQNLSNLQRTDKSGQVGEPQEATVNPDRPEGDTDVNKTVIVTLGNDSDGNRGAKQVFYDGIDNGVIVYIKEDGSLLSMTIDEDIHNLYRDNPIDSDN